MKRFWPLMAVLLLLGSMTVTAAAAQDALKMDDVTVQPGQTVYMTVTLEESVTGDTMGLTYDYDRSLLKAVPSQCQWKKTAALKDFSATGSEAAWAAVGKTDLKGEICVLVFQLLTEEPFADSVVTCQLLVKAGPNEVGRYEASASVSSVCPHNYGSWEENGVQLHTRVCSICGGRESQSHSWGDPTVSTDPQDPATTVKAYRCSICGGEKTETEQNDLQEVLPTTPSHTTPTEPEYTVPVQPTLPLQQPAASATVPTAPTTEPTRPTQPATEPTGPTQTPSQNLQNQQQSGSAGATAPSTYQPRDYNAVTEATEEEERTAQDKENRETGAAEKTDAAGSGKNTPDKSADKPVSQTLTSGKPQSAAAQAENAPQSARQESYTGVWVIAAASAALMALPELLKKKKDRH